jgi:hypothetical protein
MCAVQIRATCAVVLVDYLYAIGAEAIFDSLAVENLWLQGTSAERRGQHDCWNWSVLHIHVLQDLRCGTIYCQYSSVKDCLHESHGAQLDSQHA